MANQLPETTYFGLTQQGPNESAAKNGYAFGTLNIQKIDTLLQAALYHTHTGDPALGDPTDAPDLVAMPTGGSLPSNTTFYYRVAYVDQWGLETASGPEGSVITPSPIDAPNAPAVTVELSSGTVTPGVYAYLITFVDSYGGQTTPSGLASAQVLTGSTNRVRLDMPALPTGAVSFKIYRSRPGQTQFYYLGTTAAATFYDDGSAEDQTITVPTLNSTNASNAVQVTIPQAFIPEGCFGWKIYRALQPGNYSGTSLVHWVVEGTDDTDTTPVLQWLDVGDALQPGFPSSTNSSAPSGIQLSYDNILGSLPLLAMPRGAQVLSTYVAGGITNQQTVNVTEVPMPLQPTRFTAFFKTLPSPGSTVRFRFQDSATPTPNYVEVSCPSSSAAGDPSGYFHIEYPLYITESFEAEDGTRSSTATVDVVNDLAASSGQAVALTAQNEYVQVPLGMLDAGQYTTTFTSRVLQFASSSTNDLEVAIIRLDNNTVLGTPVTFTLTAQTGANDPTLYLDRNGPAFTAPGGVNLVMRVTKKTTTTQAYNVDKMAFLATVPTLQPGTITGVAFVDNGPTAAADVNLALWF